MASCTLRNGVIVSEKSKPYIIAEVNTSHNGKMDVAKEMINSARDAGCDCVKFQSFSPESINSKSFYMENPMAKRFFDRFSFSEESQIELAEHCRAQGIDFASTPYSKYEVDFLLEKCNVPFIKVASMEINNYMYLEYIANTGAPIVLSTGMADMCEVEKAVEIVKKSGNKNLCLLHCISIYPPEISTIRLKNIVGLKEKYPEYPIGFSDHSLGIEMAPAAVALGASVVEKHLTLDNTKIGMDNQMALMPDEMSQLVKNCQNVHLALGSMERVVLEAETNQRQKMRRSIVAARELKKGAVLSLNDLDVKRPGTGIPPDKIDWLIGKTIIKDIECDTLITEDCIKI